MSLENPNIVDLVALNATGDEVIVHIIATEPWGEDQFFQLQAKLKSTVAFMADGQLERTYPEVTGKMKIIEIRADFPPSEAITNLVNTARKQWCAPESIRLSLSIPKGSGTI